jgi:hypothetical protein
MSKRPRFAVQLVMDVVAILVFAMFTLSMAATFTHMRTWEFRTFTLAVAAWGLYFTVRALINFRDTVVRRTRSVRPSTH